jgi:hypothetical protein
MADVAVLDADPLAVSDAVFAGTAVAATLMAGRFTFRAQGFRSPVGSAETPPRTLTVKSVEWPKTPDSWTPCS